MGRLSRRLLLVVVGIVLAASPVAAEGEWAPFRDIGGVFAPGAPITAISRKPNQIDLFVTGLNGHVYTSSYTAGGDWTGLGNRWRDIGGVFESGAPIAAVARNPNQIDLFITGLNGHVYTSYMANGGPWSGEGDKWRDIGGVFQPSAPLAAVSRNANRIDVFVTGLNGHVYTSGYVDGSDWTGLGDNWRDIGGVFPVSAALAALARHPNQIDLFVTGHDGHVYTSFMANGGPWSGEGDKWRDIGGSFPAGVPVSAVSRNPNQIDLFITGHNGNVYTSGFVEGGDWTGLGDRWNDVGGVFPPGAKVVAVSSQRSMIDLFITGHNGVVYTSRFVEGGGWSGVGNRWQEIGGSFPAGAALAALARQPDLLDVFVTGHDGIVYTSWSGGGGTPGKPTPPPPNKPPAMGAVQVVQSVDVYDAPDGNGNVLGTLPKGAKGIALAEPCRDNWCHIKWSNGHGWVYDGADYDSLRY